MSYRSCPDPWEVRHTAQREAREQWWSEAPRERYDDCEESNRQYARAFNNERDEMRQEEQRREERECEEVERERRRLEQLAEEEYGRAEEEAYYQQLAEQERREDEERWRAGEAG